MDTTILSAAYFFADENSIMIELYFRDHHLWDATFWSNKEIKAYWEPVKEQIIGLPMTTKADYQKKDFSSDTDKFLYYKTSGSSGEPFGYSVLREDMAINALRFSIMMLVNEYGVRFGVKFPEKKLLYLVFNQPGKEFIKINFKWRTLVGGAVSGPDDYNILQLGTYGSDSWIADAAEALETGEYEAIVGPPSKIAMIAEHIPQGMVVQTGSERTSSEFKSFMTRNSNPHFDFFHAPDGGAIFYKCRNGTMHLWHFKALVELDEENRLLSTPIYPGETQFRRYFAGDVIENGSMKWLETPCGCGRSGMAVSKGATMGRIMERIKLPNKTIDGIDVYVTLSAMRNLGRWKVVQSGGNEVNIYSERNSVLNADKIRALFSGAKVNFLDLSMYEGESTKEILIRGLQK